MLDDVVVEHADDVSTESDRLRMARASLIAKVVILVVVFGTCCSAAGYVVWQTGSLPGGFRCEEAGSQYC